ncbi:MAG: hypothetical protein H6824_01150 [Planctomycetaceae bacterium]|nr:hypothetical protein [Planctomycetaceae bacterium]
MKRTKKKWHFATLEALLAHATSPGFTILNVEITDEWVLEGILIKEPMHDWSTEGF